MIMVSIMMLTYYCVGIPLSAVVALYMLIAVGTISLATIAKWNNKTNSRHLKSSLYVGRVAHTRYFPVPHCFDYPLFMVCVDLDDDLSMALWPLSIIMTLRESDHYKNKEGGGASTGTKVHTSLAERTLQLVQERTTKESKSPTRYSLMTHRVLLVTHLCYYGYCFNPVSFYYILRRDDEEEKIDAIVAEVSNTPWNEMQCYVLHPNSVDVTKHQRQDRKINYIFQKSFHVSPFMDMEHTYDWIFWDFDTPCQTICISTSMIKGDKKYFNAHVKLQPRGMDPFMLAWQLIRFPVYCLLIQVWIHYEAFWLFIKGVAFVPHPKGSETTASLIIGKVMTPLFDFKDWVEEKRKRD